MAKIAVRSAPAVALLVFAFLLGLGDLVLAMPTETAASTTTTAAAAAQTTAPFRASVSTDNSTITSILPNSLNTTKSSTSRSSSHIPAVLVDGRRKYNSYREVYSCDRKKLQ